jgi:hypothetical protein
MIMYARITGTKIECVYVEPQPDTIEVEMPDNWRAHEITYDNGIVLGELIDNEYKPLI